MHILSRRLIILGSTVFALAACAHEPSGGGVEANGKTDQQAERESIALAMLKRAEELRGKGERVAALSLLADAHRRFPRDNAVVSAYGRMVLLLGHDELAAPLLRQAVAADPRDWRALSAQGVLESRRGKLPDGRRALMQASTISAGEAVILNNLAVSHLLGGKPAAAVSLLRQGLASPALPAQHERRLKRNLALALAMTGRPEEADRLAGETLPRELAQGDMATMRRLLGITEETPRAADGGWKAQIADVSPPSRPALR